ncbi:MAG: NUDIX hydrolase [Thiothrix sp.]|nr:MAG: NUDIX hydrolase [Thiothrix sp.]
MKFCSACGSSLSLKIPEGEDRLRHVCDTCGMVHYQNPKIITGVIVTQGEQILLCRRAIEPRYGLWTYPAGFMENAETSAQAAAREAQEEAQVELKNQRLFSVVDVPHANHVHVIYCAELANDAYGAGVESLEVVLFDEADIPWSELAFQSVQRNLELFLADRQQGLQRVHHIQCL